MVGRASLLLLLIASSVSALQLTPVEDPALASDTHQFLVQYDGPETAFIPYVDAPLGVHAEIEPPIVWLGPIHSEQIVTVRVSGPPGIYTPSLQVVSESEGASVPMSFEILPATLPEPARHTTASSLYLLVAAILGVIATVGVGRGALRP